MIVQDTDPLAALAVGGSTGFAYGIIGSLLVATVILLILLILRKRKAAKKRSKQREIENKHSIDLNMPVPTAGDAFHAYGERSSQSVTVFAPGNTV